MDAVEALGPLGQAADTGQVQAFPTGHGLHSPLTPLPPRNQQKKTAALEIFLESVTVKLKKKTRFAEYLKCRAEKSLIGWLSEEGNRTKIESPGLPFYYMVSFFQIIIFKFEPKDVGAL